MTSDADTPIWVEDGDLDTPSTAQYGCDDGYRVRNLWGDVFMHAMRHGWAAKTAADAADECTDRYKAKFGVK